MSALLTQPSFFNCLSCSMASGQQVAAVGRVLVDPKCDLTQRFRALFTLRNLGGKTSMCCVVYILLFDTCVVITPVLSLLESRKITLTFLLEFTFCSCATTPVLESLSDNWESSQNVIQNSSAQLLFFFREPSQF